MTWDITCDSEMCPFKDNDNCLSFCQEEEGTLKECSLSNCRRIQLVFHERYKKVIGQFFAGVSYFEDRKDGHIWVAEHDHFHTLTVEPPEGGQFEIAVRFKRDKHLDEDIASPWAGYFVGIGILVGINTSGH